jgi:hypothetical protein
MSSPKPEGESPQGNKTEELPDSYAFVMNVNSLVGETSFRLADGHHLRRADTREIAEIKETLQKFAPFTLFIDPVIPQFWECPWPVPVGRLEPLPEAQWRYFVIAFRGPNTTLTEIQEALDLARMELEIAFTVLYSSHFVGPAFSFASDRFFQVLRRARHNSGFFVDVNSKQVEEIGAIRTLLQAYDSKLVEPRLLLAQLRALKGLPHESPLRFLGYFAVLESLLTHAPKPTDPYESLTRQIKKKLSLLNHRFIDPIEYGAFGDTSAEKIWTTMYICRSQLAHGRVPDFTKDLQLLKSYDQALSLLKETTKLVIVQALREPQLLVDLREC